MTNNVSSFSYDDEEPPDLIDEEVLCHQDNNVSFQLMETSFHYSPHRPPFLIPFDNHTLNGGSSRSGSKRYACFGSDHCRRFLYHSDMKRPFYKVFHYLPFSTPAEWTRQHQWEEEGVEKKGCISSSNSFLQQKQQGNSMNDDDNTNHCHHPMKKEMYNSGRWSNEEQTLFLRGLRKHGKGQWKKIGETLKTRSTIQIKSHGQKMIQKLEAGDDIFALIEGEEDDKQHSYFPGNFNNHKRKKCQIKDENEAARALFLLSRSDSVKKQKIF